MILRKTKFSYVTNVIFALLASALCILVIMDAAAGFGVTYMTGLISFAVIMAVGLIIKKLLSYTANSDHIKVLFDKGNLLGSVVFVILVLFSIAFKFASYNWNGLGGTAYFELAKVTGDTMDVYVHACDHWYIFLLHSVFFLFGNKIFIAAIFNCVLQLLGVVFGFMAFKKLLGIVPALFFTGFWTITGFSVHEALTLNSRNLVFLLFTLALFALSTSVPATEGGFFGFLMTGLLCAVCIYADIAGLVLLPFIAGILFNVGEEETGFGLRFSKLFFTLVSIVFFLVLMIFADSYLTSTNPFKVLSAMVSLYEPHANFSLGFSYMTLYVEVIIMAVVVAFGIFVSFFEDDDSRSILTFSFIAILLINNFSLTYLENDGREIIYMLGAVIAGVCFRGMFPSVITGDLFKASAEMYDNEISYPEKGYVPTGLSNGGMDVPEMDEIEMEEPAPKAKEKAVEDTEEEDHTTKAPSMPPVNSDKDNAYAPPSPQGMASYATPVSTLNFENSTPGVKSYATPVSPLHGGSSASSETPGKALHETSQTQNNVSTAQPGSAVLPAVHQDNAPTVQPGTASYQKTVNDTSVKSGETAVNTATADDQTPAEAPKKTEYTYRKPQLKPEYRRRPGAWIQQVNEKNADKKQDSDKNTNPEPQASSEKDQSHDSKNKQTAANNPTQSTVPAQSSVQSRENADSQGVTLLENPIPHPVRKTEHKAMEYDVDVTASDMDYDIKVSDNDDFDI